MKTTRNTTPRQLPAVTGSAKLLQAVGTVGRPEERQGEIAINGKAYFVRILEHGYSLFGFDAKRQDVTHYDLPADLSACDCLDYLHRAGRREDGLCKHCKGLRSLVNAGKLPRVQCNPIPRVDDLADADEIVEAA